MNKKVGTVRPSQVITTFGPGAIVDLPDFSVIIGGIDKWEKNIMLRYSQDIDEPRLRKKLKINKIKSIPITSDNDGLGTLPAFLFPEFYVCPKCRKLAKSREFTEENGILYCQNNKKEGQVPCKKIKVHPVRFITACKSGHVDDFPWGFYLHSKYKKKYDYKKCKLYLEDKGKSGSISDLVVSCITCDIERSMADAFRNEKLLGKCKGRQPWLGLRNSDEEDCANDTKLLLRGASNLYFSILESSIVVPFQDNPLEYLVLDEIDFDDDELINDKTEFMKFAKRNKQLKTYDLEEIWSLVQRLKHGLSDGDEDLLLPEWDAITSGVNDFNEPDFEVELQTTPARFEKFISKLIRVKRLKEVMVLKGFTRIHPLPDATLRFSGEDSDDENSSMSTLAPLSNTKLDWLPGVETYGEGIFLSIKEDVLEDWVNKNHEYEKSLEHAHRSSFLDRKVPEESIPAFPGLRYVLLHSLSHALIRELCLHSGYSSSALKERIYSNKEKGMAGILIYTATVDSEGSLGGLVELGGTNQFESILARALAAAGYCSGDPLCSEHDANRLQDVNGAACHSCLLISETSCEKSNRYLDRSTLVPTVSNLHREFFNV